MENDDVILNEDEQVSKNTEVEKQREIKTGDQKEKQKDPAGTLKAKMESGGVEEFIEHGEPMKSEVGVKNENNDEVDIAIENLDINTYEEMRNVLENDLVKWQTTGNDFNTAIELWKNYTSLTRDLSFYLCEQLRLILEPTLSTKLKGDYRNGKRLNMRKIIPYIASNFKKDKIWMKRTKPSKRTYQILLSIDDSRSMASSHSVQLAFESLALIITAFQQLEVGEVGIMSFGETTKLLHSFDNVWNEEEGARLLQSFTFKQDRTKISLLMDQSLEILNATKFTQKASDLWQLQIILSDGICEDHSYIRNRVLTAMEDRIATVFIILDTRPEAN